MSGAFADEAAGLSARIDALHDQIGRIDADPVRGLRFGWLAGFVLLTMLTFLVAVTIVVFPLSTGTYPALAVLGLFALLLLGWGLVGCWRRASGASTDHMRQRRALTSEVERLQRQLAGASPLEHGAVLTGGTVPTSRQASVLATALHRRFPLGPAPAERLRVLPVEATRRAAFHRRLGWGFVGWVVVALLLLAGYAILRAVLV